MFVRREPWVDRAKCRGLNPDLFILGKGGRPDGAIACCNGADGAPPCPVKKECLEHGINTGSEGVWGGEFFRSKEAATTEVIVEIKGIVDRIE